MPLGLAHSARAEASWLASERSKRGGRNLYSSGFGGAGVFVGVLIVISLHFAATQVHPYLASPI